MKPLLIHNAKIVNEGNSFIGSVLIKEGKIKEIWSTEVPDQIINSTEIFDATGKVLIPGVIDDQVHFREPGLTSKADIYSESKAAIAGGITSFMEMPNTIPQTITQESLNQKIEIASKKSLANYSFYIGATNDNLDELLKTNPVTTCGIKVFMGSSTGNMLVDNINSLKAIFSECNLLIATHCEDETTIKNNIAHYKKAYGEEVSIKLHPKIRSEEACYKSSSLAVELATKYNSRLHILHLSTKKELSLLDNSKPADKKNITAEVCVHHLWFNDSYYDQYGTRIKWNPAIKSVTDQNALFNGILSNHIDVIATDHAPHTIQEKMNSYFKAPSGGPLVQHSLTAMLEFYHKNKISLEKIVEKMCHTPATIFKIDKRGYIRKNYYADLVLLDLNQKWIVNKDNILYKCGWSPFEGQEFQSIVSHTFVNGNLVYDNGSFNEHTKGMQLIFKR